MNKYLFLDIDGVLNHGDWFASDGYKRNQSNWEISMFDPECVARLNIIMEKTNAELVISSSWRSMRDLKQILVNVGIDWDFKVTPHADVIYPDLDPIRDLDNDDIRYWRGSEIKWWLDHNCDEPYTYCILDDDADMLNEQINNFVMTCNDGVWNHDLYRKNLGSGLTEYCMNKVIEILNNEIH